MTSFSRFRVLSTLLLIALLGLPTILAADSNVRIVQVSHVGGDVLVTQGASTQAVRVKNYLPLQHGALVETQDGVVEIEFENELLARLAEGSRLDLSELVLRDDGSRLTRLTLREGTATFSAKLKEYDTFQIVTPYFTVTALRNAKVRVDLTEQGGRVKVLDGNVEVETPDDVLELKEGRQLEWDVASAQVALGSAGEADGWDEWNQDRDEAIQSASRARRWSVQVASSPDYNNRYHYGHSHRYGYCPYYSYGSSLHYAYYQPLFSFWGIGFGYHSHSYYYPGYYSGYYPVFAGGYWPYSYGARRHHRHYNRRAHRRDRRDRHDRQRGTVAGSTVGDDGDRVRTRQRGERDRVTDRVRSDGVRERARVRNTDRQRGTNPDRTSARREDILRRLAERSRPRVSPQAEGQPDRRTRVSDRQRPTDASQSGDRRRETIRRLEERGTARRASSGSRGTTPSRRTREESPARTRQSDNTARRSSPRQESPRRASPSSRETSPTRRTREASPSRTRQSDNTARRSSPRREAPRQAAPAEKPSQERSSSRARKAPEQKQSKPARTRAKAKAESSRSARSTSNRSPSRSSSASRSRSANRSASSAGRSRSSARASRPSRSSGSARSSSSGKASKASRSKRDR